MFYLTIGVLKDLIKNINKENKCMEKQIQQIKRTKGIPIN
jgi:hypothetical protein